MYGLWHVTQRTHKELENKKTVIGADMAALNHCHYEEDVFFYNLIVIAKGSKVMCHTYSNLKSVP